MYYLKTSEVRQIKTEIHYTWTASKKETEISDRRKEGTRQADTMICNNGYKNFDLTQSKSAVQNRMKAHSGWPMFQEE